MDKLKKMTEAFQEAQTEIANKKEEIHVSVW